MNKHISIWFLCCFLAIATLVMPAAQAETIGIAAIVNDTIITTDDVQERGKLLVSTGSGNLSKAAVKRAESRALQMLVNEALQMQEAKRLSVDVTEEEIQNAIIGLEKARHKPAGSLIAFLEAQGIDKTTMINQVRAQIAWNKVVTERLRRNVTISDDEIIRAQFAENNAPGRPHYHISALSVPIKSKDQEEKAADLARNLLKALSSGEPFAAVARKVAGSGEVIVQPSVWVPEESLEPPIAAALRELSPGQVTRPLRSLNSFQIIQYRDKRDIKPLPANTELILKNTLLPLSQKTSDAEFVKLLQAARAIQESASICNDAGIPANILPENYGAQSQFSFSRLDKLAPPLVPIVVTLNVGETSDPVATPEGLRMVSLCEKAVPAAGFADSKVVRQKLFSEKVELEAVKHLRNLKRDAFIEIKSPGRA